MVSLPVAPSHARSRGTSTPLVMAALYFFAVSWPLGAYQRLLGPIHAHHIAAALIVFAALRDLIHTRRLSTPFELWWPCALIAALTLTSRIIGVPIAPWALLIQAPLFVCVYHVVSHRNVVNNSLNWAFVGGCGVLIMSLMVRAGWLFPTAYTADLTLTFAGPAALSRGLVFLVLLAIAAFSTMVCDRQETEKPHTLLPLRLWHKNAVARLYVLLLCVYLFPAFPFQNLTALFAHDLFLYPALLVTLPGLWLSARVASKIMVEHWGKSWCESLVPAIAVLLGAWLVTTQGVTPDAGPVFLLALFAARGKPNLPRSSGSALHVWVALPVVLLTITHLIWVFPGDPRNYETRARTLLIDGEYDTLLHELDAVHVFAPDETRVDHYRARALLRLGDASGATRAFARSLRTSTPRLLPPPGAVEMDLFLSELRDYASASPEELRGLAYETALIAAGRERHALSLLELRGEPGPQQSVLKQPLAAGLAAVLNAPHLESILAHWDAARLTAILVSAGPANEIRVAPTGFPDEHLPLVVMARALEEECSVMLFTPEGRYGAIRHHTPGLLLRKDLLRELLFGWDDWQPAPGGGWRLFYGAEAEVHLSPAPVIRTEPLQPDGLRNGGDWEVLLFTSASGALVHD